MSGIREIEVSQITEAVKDMCIAANYGLSEDMQESLKKAASQETSPLGTQIPLQKPRQLRGQSVQVQALRGQSFRCP